MTEDKHGDEVETQRFPWSMEQTPPWEEEARLPWEDDEEQSAEARAAPNAIGATGEQQQGPFPWLEEERSKTS
jgi:hypothetical protein